MKKKEAPILRPDFLFEGKQIKACIEKSVYVDFQKRLLDLGITQKQALREFCKMIVNGDAIANRFLNDIARRIFKGELDRLYRSKNEKIVDKLDHDVLYHLIENTNNEETDIDTSDD